MSLAEGPASAGRPAGDELDRTVDEVTTRVVQPAPSGRGLVWIWRSADRPDQPVFMQYGDPRLLDTFRAVLAYVVRGVWHRAYRLGVRDGASGAAEGAETQASMLPPANATSSLPEEPWLAELLRGATEALPHPEAEALAREALALLAADGPAAELERIALEIRRLTEDESAWGYLCAEILVRSDGRRARSRR